MAIPSGEIYLLHNVPLTASYEYTIDFKDKEEQLNYFLGFRKYTFDKYTYIRKEREFLTFELPIALADEINYMLFRPASGERWYFAFVGNKRFVNQDVTEMTYEIDVMQTYMFDYTFNPSYIRQAHVDRWTAERKPIYSKTDEGIFYGTEYNVESAYRLEQSDLVRWLLVSVKDYSEMTAEGYADMPLIGPAPSPFACFIVPMPLKSNGAGVPYDVYMDNVKISTYSDLVKLMTKSAFGTYVQSINVLTYNPLVNNVAFDGDVIRISLKYDVDLGWRSTVIKNDIGIDTPFLIMAGGNFDYFKSGQTLAVADWNLGIENSLPTDKQWEEIKTNPYTTKRDKRFESKLLCAPYRYNLLADWRTTPVIIKNECLPTDKIDVKFAFALSHNAPFRFWVKDYKKDPEGRNATLSQPLGLEFPVISDAYYTYMLQNKNTIQANVTNAVINASLGAVNGAISGATTGGLAGAALGGATAFIGGAVNVQNQIRSENAKQNDLRAIPDNIICNIDSSFNVVDNNAIVTFYRMAICCENEEILAEIFNMSGYKVNRVDIPNLRSRTRFNYIQTMGANITGSFSQTDIQRIKNIFDNGITIWHYNTVNFKPLDYSLENLERNLL